MGRLLQFESAALAMQIRIQHLFSMSFVWPSQSVRPASTTLIAIGCALLAPAKTQEAALNCVRVAPDEDLHREDDT